MKNKIKALLLKKYDETAVEDIIKSLEESGLFDVQEKEFDEQAIIDKTLEAVERKYSEDGIVAKALKGGTGEEQKETLGLPKGLAFARMSKMKIQHRLSKSHLSIDEFIIQQTEKHYSRDTAFCKMIKSSTMTKILKGKADEVIKDFNNSSIPSDGGYLVPEMYGEIVELLRPMVFLFQAGAEVVPMPFGNLNLPVVTVGALSYFIGEGNKAKGKKQELKNIKLVSKKQVSMCIMTNDLLLNNTYQADMKFLEDILREMAIKMNEVALTGTGTEHTPKGIENYTGVLTAGLGAQVDGDTPTDLAGLVEATNVPLEKGAFVFPRKLKSKLYNAKDTNGNYTLRDEMKTGQLYQYPFLLTNIIPVGTTGNKTTKMYFGDWSQFLVGEQSMFEVSTSDEATVIDNQGNEIQLWGQDCTAIKVISRYDFAVKYPEAFAYYSDVYTV